MVDIVYLVVYILKGRVGISPKSVVVLCVCRCLIIVCRSMRFAELLIRAEEVCMRNSSASVPNRIVPCDVNIVIVAVELDYVPGMLHRIRRTYIGLYADKVKEISVRFGISLADSRAIYKHAAGCVGYLRHGAVIQTLIVVFAVNSYSVVDKQCLLNIGERAVADKVRNHLIDSLVPNDKSFFMLFRCKVICDLENSIFTA